MESIISTFHIDWKIIIAQALNFAVVFVVLYLYALKPLAKLMEERSQKIEQGISDAKTNALLKTRVEKEYEEIISKAKAEASKIFQDGKKEAEQKKVKMMDEAKEEVNNLINTGKKVLEAEKAKMVEEAKRDIVALAMKATEKILNKSIDASLDEKTIKELSNL